MSLDEDICDLTYNTELNQTLPRNKELVFNRDIDLGNVYTSDISICQIQQNESQILDSEFNDTANMTIKSNKPEPKKKQRRRRKKKRRVVKKKKK